MFKTLFLLSCHNQYESKRYFTQKFAEALRRQKITVKILSWDHGPVPEEIVKIIENEKPDLTASFHQLPPQADGNYFWDRLKRPHWTLLLDPAFYDLELMCSPWSIISCVDRNDCALLRSYKFENVFFFPHAVERDIFDSSPIEQDIDVIFLGTCYDPDHLHAFWQKNYPKETVDILEDAVERVLSDNKTPFWRALLQALTLHGVEPKDVEFDQLAYYVDQYSRGIDRLQLIRSITHVPVHIYGGTCWREEKPIKDWSYYLSKQSNVTLHPAVNFVDALNLMKHSKICLNSMPFFKDGTHERVFAGLGCGSLPLTSDNIYLRENFVEGREILFYQFTALDEVNEKVNHFVNDRKSREEAVALGQAKVAKEHTWDSRVQVLMKEMPIKQF
jgi:spore maturation protein CgeB